MQQVHIKIERKPEVINRCGLSRSTLYSRISEGLWPPSISLGERAVGWLEHETDSVLSAMIAGKSKVEIRDLVTNLVAQRQSMGC